MNNETERRIKELPEYKRIYLEELKAEMKVRRRLLNNELNFQRQQRIKQVAEAIEKATGVTLDQMAERKPGDRKEDVAAIRQVLIYLICAPAIRTMEVPHGVVAKALNRHRTTIVKNLINSYYMIDANDDLFMTLLNNTKSYL